MDRKCRFGERGCGAKTSANNGWGVMNYSSAAGLYNKGSGTSFTTRGLGQDGAWPFDPELRGGGKGFQHGVRDREIGGERELYRGQPGESKAIDGAPAWRIAVVRGAHRRHTLQGSANDRGLGHWLRRAQNGARAARRSDRECHCGGSAAE